MNKYFGKIAKTAVAVGVLSMGLTFVACDEYADAPDSPPSSSSSSPSGGADNVQVDFVLDYPFPFDAEEWERPDITGNISFASDEGALARQLGQPLPGEGYAVMRTNHGDVYIRLFPQYAPLAVENFVTHARNGYFDNLIFHRVIEQFMIQGGDPEGTGMGGESIWGQSFGNEFTPNLQHIRGALSMANSDNLQIGRTQTNGSQFFVVQNGGLFPHTVAELEMVLANHMDDEIPGPDGEAILVRDVMPEEFIRHYIEHGGTPHLDFAHTVFGQVFRGMDVVDAIGGVPVIDPIGNPPDHRPIEDVIIETIEIRVWQ
ncbi:MAG: peptidylprolyl isomerase [Defluviitaleaceae bacterium]|nr:peptidylprolyl isomerase [Defluviitaleaceae bacterium]